MSTASATLRSPEQSWKLPSRGVVGMICLIVAESAIFIIFVVAYIFYLGKVSGDPLRVTCLTFRSLAPSVFYRAAFP